MKTENSPKKEIIQFVSPTCSSCVVQEKVLTNILDKYSDIIINNYNIYSHYDKAIQYSVKGAPTLVFIEDGRTLKTYYGFQNEEQVEDWMKLFEWI